MGTRNTYKCTNEWHLVFDSSESGAFIGPCQEINSFPALLFIGNALPTDDSAGFVLCGTTQIINVSGGQKLYAKCRHDISGSAISLVSDSDDFAAVAGNTGPSTTNGFMRWIRDKWNTIAPSNWLIVGGAAAVGQAPTANPVGVSGVDGSGLKRSLLTDSIGRVNTVVPDCAEISGSVSSADVLFTVDMLNYQSICVSMTSAGGGCTIAWETSSDGLTNWIGVSGAVIAPTQTAAGVSSSLSSVSSVVIPKRLRYFRARVSIYGSGTVSVVGNLLNTPVITSTIALCVGTAGEGVSVSGLPVTIGIEARTTGKTPVTGGQVVRPIATTDGRIVVRLHSIPESEWAQPAPSGGLLNTTTPLVVKAAAGGTSRNYLTSAQVYAEALTTATELTIENGDGAVLWRLKIPTGGLPLTSLKFEDPLKSTANASLQIRTTPASGTGAVYFNAQGYYAP